MGNPFKEYRVQSRDCQQLPNIEHKTSSDQWKLFKGDDIDS